MAQAIALQLACLGVEPMPIFPGIHATYLIHTFRVGDRAWHVLMYSDNIPRVVSDAYLRQSHINLEKELDHDPPVKPSTYPRPG